MTQPKAAVLKWGRTLQWSLLKTACACTVLADQCQCVPHTHSPRLHCNDRDLKLHVPVIILLVSMCSSTHSPRPQCWSEIGPYSDQYLKSQAPLAFWLVSMCCSTNTQLKAAVLKWDRTLQWSVLKIAGAYSILASVNVLFHKHTAQVCIVEVR